jgi:Zn-dependent protease
LYILLLVYMIILNTGLGVFNLLPIPPLDGSHVFENLLPPHASATYRRLGRYAPLVLVGLIVMDHYMNIRILSTVLIFPIKFLAGLFGGTNFQAVTGW